MTHGGTQCEVKSKAVQLASVPEHGHILAEAGTNGNVARLWPTDLVTYTAA